MSEVTPPLVIRSRDGRHLYKRLSAAFDGIPYGWTFPPGTGAALRGGGRGASGARGDGTENAAQTGPLCPC